MVGSSGILDIRKEKKVVMMTDKLIRWKRILNRFVGSLRKLISKDNNSPKITQI